jgi:hypothetical protein
MWLKIKQTELDTTGRILCFVILRKYSAMLQLFKIWIYL